MEEMTWRRMAAEMAGALWARFRLWLHCLVRMHRSEEETIGKGLAGVYVPLVTVSLACHDCDREFYRFPGRMKHE